MKITRRQLRNIIQENLEKRIKMADDIERLGIEQLPGVSIEFLEAPKARYKKEIDPETGYLALDAGPMERYRQAMQPGSELKKLFAKYADKNFMDSLIITHYTQNLAGVKSVLEMSSRDELSCSAVIPEDFRPDTHRAGTGYYGTEGLGIVVSGHVSYMTNNQDHAATGKGSNIRKAFEPNPGHFYELERQLDDDFEDRMELRDKEERPFAGTNRSVSSGVNKVPFIVPSSGTNSLMRTVPDEDSVKRYRDEYYGSKTIKGGTPPVVLDKEDYLPRIDMGQHIANEALVDNWRILAIIYNPEGGSERYGARFRKENIFSYLRELGYNGLILTHEQAEKYKNNLINNYYS